MDKMRSDIDGMEDSTDKEVQDKGAVLARKASDQNVFYSYMCELNKIRPTDLGKLLSCCDSRPSRELIEEIMEDEPKKIERAQRSQVARELKELKKDDCCAETDVSTAYPSSTTTENSETDTDDCDRPNFLKLTKMKWLTEKQRGCPDSSTPCASSSPSDCNSCCSEENVRECVSFGEKCLSTILRLDKEHNMFGLSNITIVDSKLTKMGYKEDEGPAFPQTAIIQICCKTGHCRHKSNTDLPTSLKCGRCNSCVYPYCSSCAPCGSPYDSIVCSNYKLPCLKLPLKCKPVPCSASKCMTDCNIRYGMKILVKRKPKYEPSPIEITPRSSCVLKKPYAARSCHHMPRCLPPSSCFPYLMPCFWPPRASAPCSSPAHCFHTPPCLPPRSRQSPIPAKYRCSSTRQCVDEAKKTKCPNISCPGNNPTMKKEIENRFKTATERKSSTDFIYYVNDKLKHRKKPTKCECESPSCSSCFVTKPKTTVQMLKTEDVRPK